MGYYSTEQNTSSCSKTKGKEFLCNRTITSACIVNKSLFLHEDRKSILPGTYS